MVVYCPSCGVNQPAEEGVVGKRQRVRCAVCGFVHREVVARNEPSPTPAEGRAAGRRPGRPPLPWEAGEPPRPVASPSSTPERNPSLVDPSAPAVGNTPPPAPQTFIFNRVLVAEDTTLVREIVKDAMLQNGIARQVETCPQGEDLLQTFADSIARRLSIDLVILDLEMPILGGYHTAIALRAFERGLRVRPVPVVFFTAYPFNATFKKVLEHCGPARYLNKGVDASPPRIAARLVQVLSGLAR